MKHYKLVECSSNLNVKPPLHKRKAPPNKRKALLLTNFWRRFCTGILHVQQSYGSRAVRNVFIYCMRLLSRKTAKQKCGSRLYSEQKHCKNNKNFLNPNKEQFTQEIERQFKQTDRIKRSKDNCDLPSPYKREYS